MRNVPKCEIGKNVKLTPRVMVVIALELMFSVKALAHICDDAVLLTQDTLVPHFWWWLLRGCRGG
ncbi:hypothetical protein DEO72_LG5g1939 [Vigna unguiculata]|uniref:Uncharacterized protein n=1 Tax=Vigna unguiculata TaxID=3917 RepID=A0A4D6LZD9_VIGUN|nr:hypothetical protein DEO72_LG5g1939 [Vigna unguiculata]